MTLADARKVADAVLYEGYVLYPYRVSSPKNRFRFQFGVLVPPAFAAAGFGERASMVAELPVDGAGDVRARLRFLHLRRRAIERKVGDDFEPVDRLEVGGDLFITWDEAIERELDFTGDGTFRFDGEERIELLRENGEVVARIRRTMEPLEGRVCLSFAGNSLRKLRAEVHNTHPQPEAENRDVALRASLIGAHILFESTTDLVSVIDPPAHAEDIVATCRSEGVFPVLVTRRVALASPVVLYDFPTIAPESRGDFFDATEIDEMLTLRTMTLTDEEKREARATDARAAEIVDHTDAIRPHELERLHGATSFLTVGSRVRIRLGSHRTDVQDMFLDGRTSVIEEVRDDFDGQRWIGVTLDDDPASEIYRWQGRRLWFHPEELQVLR